MSSDLPTYRAQRQWAPQLKGTSNNPKKLDKGARKALIRMA